MVGHSRSPSWSHAKTTPADSYFPSSTPRSANMLRRRSSAIHSASAGELAGCAQPSGSTPQPMSLSLGPLNSSAIDDSSDLGGGAPPSPSTLTDIILTLHASLYGVKRNVEEIREMVWRYYDGDAVFDSPLVSAHGRKRIVDQFILAFAFPGINIRSELRDVICSDFEFDGTRAGIIDHTITVSLFPNLFRSRLDADGSTFSSDQPLSQGNVTPHPFANYATPTTAEGSGIHRSRCGTNSALSPATPATPFPTGRSSSFSGRGWSSRPRTPRQSETESSTARSVHELSPRPFVGGESSDVGPIPRTTEPMPLDTAGLTPSGSRDSMGTPIPAPLNTHHPSMPLDTGIPRWSATGLGRSPMWLLLLNLISPGRTIRSLFSIEMRLLSRLEFNEAGRIVRHEDSWSVRELLDGIFPFLSLCTCAPQADAVYNLERFLTGLFTSWLIRLLY